MAFEETAEELAAERPLPRLRPRRPDRAGNCSPSTTSTSSGARSRRPASTTWRACSSGWATPSTPSGPSGSCWTRSRRSSAGCPNEAILRAELRRLFRWLKDKGVTAIITGERGEGTLTRHGLEEYVSDCVILLDHRVARAGLHPPAAGRQVPRHAPRHQRIPVPDRRGRHHRPADHLVGLDHAASDRAGLHAASQRLDAMLGGKGFYRGSSVLVSGTAGTGKTSLAAHFADAACRRGERCLYFAFEESPDQIIRNMRSIGMDLGRWVDRRAAAVPRRPPDALRPGDAPGDDAQADRQLQPGGGGRRPDQQLHLGGTTIEVKAMLMRLVDFLKARQITALFTSLTTAAATPGADRRGRSPP